MLGDTSDECCDVAQTRLVVHFLHTITTSSLPLSMVEDFVISLKRFFTVRTKIKAIAARAISFSRRSKRLCRLKHYWQTLIDSHQSFFNAFDRLYLTRLIRVSGIHTLERWSPVFAVQFVPVHDRCQRRILQGRNRYPYQEYNQKSCSQRLSAAERPDRRTFGSRPHDLRCNVSELSWISQRGHGRHFSHFWLTILSKLNAKVDVAFAQVEDDSSNYVIIILKT